MVDKYFCHIFEEYSYNIEKGKRCDDMILYSQLRHKEVINIRDCKCLGKVTDMEFDERSGCICKIIVGDICSWFCLFKASEDIVILYKDIKQIGPDIILVDINC